MRNALFVVIHFSSFQRCGDLRGAETFPKQRQFSYLLCGAQASGGKRAGLWKAGKWGQKGRLGWTQWWQKLESGKVAEAQL